MRFDMICAANEIEHRLTKPNHPWTNGQVERMNRTIKDATVKRYHYDSHNQLRCHLSDFFSVYNYARRLKTLSGLNPYEYICKIWTSEPDRFILNPIHQMPGLNILPRLRPLASTRGESRPHGRSLRMSCGFIKEVLEHPRSQPNSELVAHRCTAFSETQRAPPEGRMGICRRHHCQCFNWLSVEDCSHFIIWPGRLALPSRTT